MRYFARAWSRESRRRPVSARFAPAAALEALEQRTMLSGSGASPAASQAEISTTTVLAQSLTTAVTGARVILGATVDNASTGAQITSGKISFVVTSPKKTVLDDVNVVSGSPTYIVTTDLTDIADYSIKAVYTPKYSGIAPSVSAPVTVKVVPVPLNVPTTTTLVSGASTAETGQTLPLVATVNDAGTGVQVNAGLIEPISGSVAFVTEGPNPIVVGEVKVKPNGVATLSSSILKNLGTYQIEAEFLPSNNYYAESTSAPVSVTIAPQTVSAPTVTTLQTSANSIETGEPIGFSVAVQNSNSNLAGGVVTLATVARHPQVVAQFQVNSFGQVLSVSSFKLEKVGSYKLDAQYTPNSKRFAPSTSAISTVTITPLTAAAFRVTPVVRHGHPGQPRSFEVTAINGKGQPVTNYTGTVVFSSPTDSWTIFPAATYEYLATLAPSNLSPTLAQLSLSSYTFTPADHGSQTFDSAVTFNKGGAQTVKVVQSNDPKVKGIGTFSIE
jgi:hypothetical protein